ncbi:MAG TPA: alpha/beta fold hydrolase [Humisphaera sp.]|nr:alpha/beta fold hydrolase [Humisphaera sp.]
MRKAVCFFIVLPALLAVAAMAAPPGKEDAVPSSYHTRVMAYHDEQGHENPVRTPEDWRRRRREILAGFQAVAGPLPDRANLPPLDIKITEEVKLDGTTRQTIQFVGQKDAHRIPAYLYIPTPAPSGKKLPAILALHPTSTLGKDEIAGKGKPNREYGLELARRGYVVLCPDYPSFGDYPCDFTDPQYASGTMLGIFNHMRCVDLLQSLPQVDPQRIGVIGHSLGGHNAMFVALFDDRIKVIVSSCGWTPFADYYAGKIAGWTSPRYMPRLRDVYHLDAQAVPFDFYEVVAAMAPRPFFSNSPLHDSNFDVTGVKKGIAEARKVYALLHAGDAIQVRYPDCKHDFPPEIREEAYAFLDAALKPK